MKALVIAAYLAGNATVASAVQLAVTDVTVVDTYRFVAKSDRRPPQRIPPDALTEFRAMLPRLRTTIARLRYAGVLLPGGTDIAGDRVAGL